MPGSSMPRVPRFLREARVSPGSLGSISPGSTRACARPRSSACATWTTPSRATAVRASPSALRRGRRPRTSGSWTPRSRNLAAVARRDLGVDLSGERGAGAAGGLGFGLLAFCGAHLRPGADAVAEAVGLDARIASSDLVITGEGAFDATSLAGKTVGGVLERAALAGVPAVVVCGRADLRPDGVRVVSLVELVGEAEATGATRSALEHAGAWLAARASELVGTGSG